jgi:hypothetical protein
MIYSFSCPVYVFDGRRARIVAEIETRAHLEPDPNDASEWTPVAFEVADITCDDWITVLKDDAWFGHLRGELLRPERQTKIDFEWIAHRNAEGDAALYGQEA